MLILNKKYCSNFLRFLVGSLAVFFVFAGSVALLPAPARAAAVAPVQVKVAGRPAVYFLSQKNHLKKAYVNAAAYLSYGNKWSDIKTVSAVYLSSWPEAQLFRVAGSPNIYYISGGRKVLIQHPADLFKLNLVGVPVLEVGAADLAQYQSASYSNIGLAASGSGSNNSGSLDNSGGLNSNPPATNYVSVFNDLVVGANNNSLVPGTNGNLLGVFRFQSPVAATVTSTVFNLAGVYSGDVINAINAHDGNDVDYGANINWRSVNRQVTVNFRPALSLLPGVAQTVKILADLNTCATCNNQTMHLELPNAAAVTASLPATAAWPLEGTPFTLVSVGTGVLGAITAQADSLASSSINTSGTRLIGQWTLSETSGHEDVLVTQMTFTNGGTANLNDWQNFVLAQDGQTIARTAALDSSGRIVFNINYLRVPKSGLANLNVTAGIMSGYNPLDTYNLQLTTLTAVGASYNMTLVPTINNLSETFPLN